MILITGSSGRIGGTLAHGLNTEYQLSRFDLKTGSDVLDVPVLFAASRGVSAIIHCALDEQAENWKSPKIEPKHLQMASNIYEAALANQIPRVIIASSVHADNFYHWQGPVLMDPDAHPHPKNPYGITKVATELLGSYYAETKGFEVVCIRFGGVNRENRPPTDTFGRGHWLSHEDLLELFRTILRSMPVSHRHTVMYAVSSTQHSVHDTVNPWGWKPR